jgi:hypothetical protein
LEWYNKSLCLKNVPINLTTLLNILQ